MEMRGKGMLHVLGGTEWYSVRFHHILRTVLNFKTYVLFLEFLP